MLLLWVVAGDLSAAMQVVCSDKLTLSLTLIQSLSIMAVGCMPSLLVGFQDEGFMESVESFIVHSGCAIKGGCVHTCDMGVMYSEWEQRLSVCGLACHPPPTPRSDKDRESLGCFEGYWSIEIEDWWPWACSP
ncbi:hypothetical protein PM082_020806 [Marasmius tenuissimus]|nr:hypothetical protein PM082_020806 [Marasmius tenuissimus]